jgi:hypothetical protein
MEISKKLLYEALKVVNLQFDNNVNILLNKKNYVNLNLTNFKKELLKNNPKIIIISNETLYEFARKLTLTEIRQSIPQKPPS